MKDYSSYKKIREVFPTEDSPYHVTKYQIFVRETDDETIERTVEVVEYEGKKPLSVKHWEIQNEWKTQKFLCINGKCVGKRLTIKSSREHRYNVCHNTTHSSLPKTVLVSLDNL